MEKNLFLTHLKNSIIEKELSDEQLFEIMEPSFPDLSMTEFYEQFDHEINVALKYVELFIENWKDYSLSELIYDSCSCSQKIARVLQKVPQYIKYESISVISEHNDEVMQYKKRINTILDSYDDIIYRIGLFMEDDKPEFERKKLESYQLNMVAIPKFFEQSLELVKTPKETSQQDELIFRYENMLRLAKTGYNESKINDFSYQKDGSKIEMKEEIVKQMYSNLKDLYSATEIQIDYYMLPVTLLNLLYWGVTLPHFFYYNDKLCEKAFIKCYIDIVDSPEFKKTIHEDADIIKFNIGHNELTIEDYSILIQDIKNKLQTDEIGKLYIHHKNNIPEFIRQLRVHGIKKQELKELLLKVAILHQYQYEVEKLSSEESSDEGNIIDELIDETKHKELKIIAEKTKIRQLYYCFVNGLKYVSKDQDLAYLFRVALDHRTLSCKSNERKKFTDLLLLWKIYDTDNNAQQLANNMQSLMAQLDPNYKSWHRNNKYKESCEQIGGCFQKDFPYPTAE